MTALIVNIFKATRFSLGAFYAVTPRFSVKRSPFLSFWIVYDLPFDSLLDPVIMQKCRFKFLNSQNLRGRRISLILRISNFHCIITTVAFKNSF